MASKETVDIDAIDNIITMAMTMSSLGVSAKGLNTLDEMKAKVKLEISKSQEKARWTAGKAFSVLSDTKEEDVRKRKELLRLYSLTENCLNNMNGTLIRLLDSNLAIDVKESIKNYQKRLSVKECVVLVAGETSAGKSSLVNLILGEELLPYALLSTTSTICELKYGEKKRIVAHYKNEDTGQATKEISLIQPKEGQTYLDQLSPYLHIKGDRQRGSPFKKIELFWPHELLEKGIVIVDSPGIGESDIMDQIVTEYIPEAFCFIYVINSCNAGGVQKDRIVKLVQDAQKVSVRTEQRFLSECALFVCNKWDSVPLKETSVVKKDAVKKLRECWPNLDPQLQVLCISTLDATTAQRVGTISPDFEALINGIESMILRTIEARLQTNWRWLNYLLSRMIYHTKAFIHNAEKDWTVVSIKLVMVAERIKQIENEQNSIMKNLQDQLDVKTDEAVRNLSEHLTSKVVEKNLTCWTDDDAPKKQETWAATENDVMKVVKARFLEEMKRWEEDNHIFSETRRTLIQRFSARLRTVQAQIQNVENSIASDSPIEQESPKEDISLTTTQKILIGVTSPLWIPFGLIALVIGIPVFGVKSVKDVIEEKSKLRSYDKDRCGYLVKKSKEYLSFVTKENSLRPYVKEQLREVEVFLEQIKVKIPAVLMANCILLEQLLVETVSKGLLEKLYRPVNAKSMAIRGDLTIFAIKEVRPTDISLNELDWKEDGDYRLGHGAFATVYKASMQKGVKKKSVAIKVFNDALNTSNAYQLWAEEEILRKLSHPNIVKFYGTALMHQDIGTRMIFVMELCKGNLKDYRQKHPEKIPGKRRDVVNMTSTIKVTIQWAIEISLALSYIHKNGIVHRDLKTENILISKDDSAKIADVGISTKVADVTGTIAGTPIYMAPEVFASMVYDSKADIYSFGLILWEMWYGETVFSELLPINFQEFGKLIREDRRPTPPEGSMPAPPSWVDLMKKCWSTKPENRITARDCIDELNTFMKHFNF